MPFRLVLASGSVGRRELLRQAGYTFDIQAANIDEPTEAINGDIRGYVHHVSWSKNAAVTPTIDGPAVVVSADTVGWLDGHVIGKPDDRNHARRIIESLSGRIHELWTGVCVWHRPSDRQICWQERSLVEMRLLGEAEIEAYLDTRQWEGCSGAYAIRDHDDPFLTIVEGSLSNVIGLPMESLAEVLLQVSTTFGDR